jgi:hypothetical protein
LGKRSSVSVDSDGSTGKSWVARRLLLRTPIAAILLKVVLWSALLLCVCSQQHPVSLEEERNRALRRDEFGHGLVGDVQEEAA